MYVIPTHNRLLVKAERIAIKESTTSSGLIIPATTNENLVALRGHVVEVGPDATIPRGAQVLVPSFAGYELHLNDTDYLLLREDEVLATLETEAD